MIAKQVRENLKVDNEVVTIHILTDHEGPEYIGTGATGTVIRIDDEGHCIHVDFGEQGLWWAKAYEIGLPNYDT